MAIGINVSSLDYYANQRSYANLVAPGYWRSNIVSGYGNLPAAQIDPDGVVKYLNPGEVALVTIPHPAGPYVSKTIKCTFSGKGKMGGDGFVKVKSQGTGYTEYNVSWSASTNDPGWVHIAETNPADPVRQIDCREPDIASSELYAPALITSLQGFKVIRFLDWQGINSNKGGDWNGFLPENHQFRTSQPEGARVDDMVALANQLGADAWFNIPYNADETYIQNFAKIVRDKLAPGRKVYVELGNELWNYMFLSTLQAAQEGKALKLSSNDHQAMLFRYSQKSAQALKIWTEVFAGQSSRLVRVVSTQNSGAWSVEQVLGFPGTAQYVDAVATAPYIQFDTNGYSLTNLEKIFVDLNTAVDETLNLALQAKAVAKSFNKRYIAYEGGQHIVTSDIAFAEKIQRDPKMETLYKSYLSKWQTQIGDLIVLFSHTGSISQFGSWGLREYADQDPSEAPKWRAVQSYLNK